MGEKGEEELRQDEEGEPRVFDKVLKSEMFSMGCSAKTRDVAFGCMRKCRKVKIAFWELENRKNGGDNL